MKLTVEGLEKERDFYFGKLRDIEVLCQEPDAAELQITKNILDILYATEVRDASIDAFLFFIALNFLAFSAIFGGHQIIYNLHV